MSGGESKGEGEGDKADKMRLGFEGDNEAEREADAGQERWGRTEGGERARHHRQQCGIRVRPSHWLSMWMGET